MLGWMDGYKCNFWPLSTKFAKQICLQSGFCYKNFCHSLGRKATEYALPLLSHVVRTKRQQNAILQRVILCVRVYTSGAIGFG